VEGVLIMVIHKNRIRYDIESVRSFVNLNSDCELLDDNYIKNTVAMNFKCGCGNVFKTTFAKFKNRNKRQCNSCGYKLRNKETRLTIKQVKSFVEKNSDCKLISEGYVESNSPLKFQCGCGNEYTTSFAKFKHRNQRQCILCSTEERVSKRRKTHDEFVNEIKDMYDNDYEILSEYKNDFTKVRVRHNKCGHKYKVTPSNILRYRRCPKCMSSKGEKFINRWLRMNRLEFQTEYSFPNLTSRKGRVLRFDFAVFEKGELKTLIEYDGGHHFKHVEGWQTKEQFKTVQRHDKLKNHYCKDNNIELLRIPHWKFDKLNEVLKNALL